ncbi:hypothetical protein BABINDRAFT_73300 [Babjeviella inositovora NRRL Y-12698]|uniref:Transcription factor TFIIIC triple barrel domain-containing protein n=1 Tax=Babjeviella inositovora NRRL Y-12698 TaxID=984486 RepID=A0A1E3QXY7_9ASCO|nr:uncharacterized protein BABINDRAFT_73300 [Babjeviella inositovora NRRL Y-12698]ODQ82525.1 hypothetical protein BABINDRAFT_73300 [Babjeviella inositovora NRRL Y-12698]
MALGSDAQPAQTNGALFSDGIPSLSSGVHSNNQHINLRPYRNLPFLSVRTQQQGQHHPHNAHSQDHQTQVENVQPPRPKKQRTTKYSNITHNFNALDPSYPLQISGLVHSADAAALDPLVKINHRTFSAKWETLVGTELIVEDDGEVVGRVHQHLRLVPGELKAKEESESAEKDKEDREEGTNNLLARALKLALEVEAREPVEGGEAGNNS